MKDVLLTLTVIYHFSYYTAQLLLHNRRTEDEER
jgi:hypothetical protein